MRMKIRTGDTVKVVTGKDAGKTGKVVRAFPRDGRVVVAGVNTVTRHQRPRKESQQGQIIEKELPIDVSNVMLVDPVEKVPTRVGYTEKDGKKVRVAKKSGTTLSS